MNALARDLTHPPHGPARWGWPLRMLTRIARARGVISADREIDVHPHSGGLHLSAAAEDREDVVTDPFHHRWLAGGSVQVKGGTVRFNDSHSETVAYATLSAGFDGFIAVRCQLSLTGTLMTPRFFSLLDFGTDVILDATPDLVSLPRSSLPSLSYLLPGSITSCSLHVPVLRCTGRRVVPLWRTWSGIEISLYHSHYTLGSL